MLSAFGFSKLYNAAQSTIQTRISQTQLLQPLSRSLRRSLVNLERSYLNSWGAQIDVASSKRQLLHSAAVSGAQITCHAVALPCRSSRHFAAEAVVEEAPTNALAWQSGSSSGATAQLIDKEVLEEIESRRASHAKASTAPQGARSRVRNPILDDSMHPIRPHDIPRGVWTVLLRLRGAGHEGYLVGGAVRDLLLRSKPKDFDILTTATPVQVKRLFGNCRIIGKRFPIVHVYADGICLEVSSFGTRARRELIPPDAAAFLPRHKPHDKGRRRGKEATSAPVAAAQPELLWSAARVENALARDFTCNAIMFDPFSALVLDYAGGFRDCQRRILRTVIDPETSFRDDPARILRAVRHAARVGLTIEEKTAQAMVAQAGEVLKLPSSRLLMEAQALFSYGAAAASLRLLWRYRLLDVLAPPLAARFTHRRVPRNPRRPVSSEPVLQLLEELDGKVQPHHPIDWTVWTAVMIAPLVTHNLEAAQQKPTSGHVAKGKTGKQKPSTKAMHKADEAGSKEIETACPLCRRSEAAEEQRARLRGVIEETVRSLILMPSAGEEVKALIPVAQWQRVSSLLVSLVDTVELPSLRKSACEACQVALDGEAPSGKPRSEVCGQQHAQLGNVLRDTAQLWLDMRQSL
ncbi:probable poly(A) polymerase I [Coccomyxa sp. Obi]|nr:probable poly(A) polymerase I [Coccomyxa sp. Obi]